MTYICTIIHSNLLKKMEAQTNNTEISKRKISPTMKNMAIGAEEIFPICQFVSVWTAINRLKKSKKLRFTTSTTEDTIKVTRTL